MRNRREALFVWPRGGNTGDDLIRDGCIRFLRDEGLDLSVSDGAIEAAALASDGDGLRALLSGFDGIVVFAGGGNLGTYPDNMIIRERVVLAARDARGILVMPQSGPGAETALRDPRVTVWARDAVTHRMLSQRGFRTDLVMDAAFNMADRIPVIPGEEGTTYLIRRAVGRCQERVELWDMSVDATGDPTFERSLDDVTTELARYGTVLSDRLHGALIAIMMGKRTGILPVGYHKNSAFYDTWLAHVPGVAYLTTEAATREFYESGETPADIDWRERFTDSARPAFRAFLRGLRRSPRSWARGLGGRRDRPTILGVSMVKNEQDIIEPFVRELAPLVDVLAVLDNDSVDRTREILSRLAYELDNIVVSDCREFAYHQSERTTAFVAQLQGIVRADFVLPLDVDEFLPVADRDELEHLLMRIPVGGIGLMPWVTYVIAPEDETTAPVDPPRTIRRHRLVEERPFFKAAIRTDGDPHFGLTIAQGNHDVVRPEYEVPRVVLDAGLRHFPVRSSEQVAAKAVVGWAAYEARSALARDEPLGYQWREISDAVTTAGLDAITLSDVSRTYAQSPDVGAVEMREEMIDWSYERRYSDGTAGDPFQTVARSWGQSLQSVHRIDGERQWIPGDRHPSPVAADRAAVRAVLDRVGARDARYAFPVPEWVSGRTHEGPSTDEVNPAGVGCVVCVWQAGPANPVTVADALNGVPDVRAVIVIPPEAGGTGIDPRGAVCPVEGFTTDVFATQALRALAASDVLRRGGLVFVADIGR